jgi:hypothetical protein
MTTNNSNKTEVTNIFNKIVKCDCNESNNKIIDLLQGKYDYLIDTYGIALVKKELDLLLELMDDIKGKNCQDCERGRCEPHYIAPKSYIIKGENK